MPFDLMADIKWAPTRSAMRPGRTELRKSTTLSFPVGAAFLELEGPMTFEVWTLDDEGYHRLGYLS